MSQQQNVETQEKFGAAVNSGELSEISQLMSPDVIDHDPSPTQGPGAAGFIAFFTEFREGFPDLAVDVEHMVADEDNVSIAYTVTGTHRGVFMGIPPTGGRSGHAVCRLRGSSMARLWSGGGVRTSLGFCSNSGLMWSLRAASRWRTKRDA